MKRIYIVRHAEADKTTRHHSLSSIGWENSINLGKYLAKQTDFPIPEKFYASDRARAIETARILLMILNKNQTDLTIDNVFGEFNPPDDELLKTEKTERYIQLTQDGKRASLYFDWTGKSDAISNYVKKLDEILKEADSVLIVSHANIINFMLMSLFPDDARVQNNIETPNLSITVLEKQAEKFTLSKIASIDWKKEN